MLRRASIVLLLNGRTHDPNVLAGFGGEIFGVKLKIA
jgi:hypothetical protein